jgi:hypothetical protein
LLQPRMFVIFSQWIHRLKCLDYIFCHSFVRPFVPLKLFIRVCAQHQERTIETFFCNLRPAKIDAALFSIIQIWRALILMHLLRSNTSRPFTCTSFCEANQRELLNQTLNTHTKKDLVDPVPGIVPAARE